MAVEKLSISVEEPLGTAIRAAAHEAGVPVSAWVARAAERQLRSEALRSFLDDWQAEHGVITEAEVAAAEMRLGLRQAAEGAA